MSSGGGGLLGGVLPRTPRPIHGVRTAKEQQVLLVVVGVGWKPSLSNCMEMSDDGLVYRMYEVCMVYEVCMDDVRPFSLSMIVDVVTSRFQVSWKDPMSHVTLI